MHATANSPPPPAAPPGIDRIELRLLRYYLAVVDERHFGRAAKRLHMSQPPLSQAVRRLEDQLGVELLDRGSRPITVTHAGRAFAEAARRVLASVDLAVAEARRAGALHSALRVGAVLHLPAEPLHRFLSALGERDLVGHPALTRLPAREQVRQLHIGDLDLGIFPQGAEDDGIEIEPLLPGEPLAVFIPNDHPLAGKQVVRPDDLGHEPVLTFRTSNPGVHERWLELLDEAGYRVDNPRDLTGASDARDLLLAVAGGSGVAIMPHSILESGQAASIVTRRRLESPASMPDTVLAWRADPPRQLERVLAGVRDIARRLYRDDHVPTPAS